MPDDSGYTPLTIHATALRPLLGLTVLVVEDSRYASEAVRLLCIRSGARIRRADSLTAAHRHLQVYRPSVVIIDLGLPDGSGIDLIAELAREDDSIRPVLIATSGADGDGSGEAALAAGANEFLPKPIASVCAFQQTILNHLPEDMRPTGPRLLSHETVSPDVIALNEDLSHIDELLGSGLDALPYVAPFLQGLARLANDAELVGVARMLSQAQTNGNGRRQAIQATRDHIQARLKVRELV
ncbi:response regulator [Litoreibacter janthinus]|uniref:Response regulator receiver domain-containing protein n=1 Tax=Litoreibacter janthinus TaxID=670154 RepID=A0A1I6GGE6_9RHOB|nr:response regulator [Litoreibacter janthinus]SFR41275.1 Response regulator receiver domain-containing protein [Litoreibacter janthinus]